MPQIMSLLALMLVCMWYEESTPRGADWFLIHASAKKHLHSYMVEAFINQ